LKKPLSSAGKLTTLGAMSRNWQQKIIRIFEVLFKMSKASSRGFGFTAIAIMVILMALTAMTTTAEAVALL
jgi:hypothetical protein